MTRGISLTVIAVAALATPVGAADIRNNTDFILHVATGSDADRSIAGLGDNGWIDPDRGLRVKGYTRLAPGQVLNNVTASYVLVQLRHGTRTLELKPADLNYGMMAAPASRTFPRNTDVTRNMDISMRYPEPGASGGNSEARRAAAVRAAGYAAATFVRVPPNGTLALSQAGQRGVFDWLARNSDPGDKVFEVANRLPNEYPVELSFRTRNGGIAVFREHKTIRSNQSGFWVADQLFELENNGRVLPVGVRAADPFAPGGFRLIGYGPNGLEGVPAPGFTLRPWYNQSNGRVDTIYRVNLQ